MQGMLSPLVTVQKGALSRGTTMQILKRGNSWWREYEVTCGSCLTKVRLEDSVVKNQWYPYCRAPTSSDTVRRARTETEWADAGQAI